MDLKSRLARLERLLAPLGPASPFVTLATFTPGARTLLAEAERTAELALHIVRGLLLLLLTAVLIIGFSSPVLAPSVIILVVGWWAVLRALIRPSPPPWLRYALIVFDGIIMIRGVLFMRGPVISDVFKQLGGAASFNEADMIATVPPLLVFLALSGALRLDPRPAAVATLVAIAGYVFLALAFQVRFRRRSLWGRLSGSLVLSGQTRPESFATMSSRRRNKRCSNATCRRDLPRSLPGPALSSGPAARRS